MFSVDFHVKGAVRDHQEKPAADNTVSCKPCNSVIVKTYKTFSQAAGILGKRRDLLDAYVFHKIWHNFC